MTELEFGERLKQYRKQKGLTQQELADLLGVSNKSVSRWESGSYPDVATLGPLAKALGVTVDDLLGTAPPIRTLGKSDWQNLLSFAFAIGGGVLYFLLVLFTPVPVAYLLYLGAMAYGVYLQKHYTYHSQWFLVANAAMDFFVNCSILESLLGFFGVAMFPNFIDLLLTSLFPSSGYSYSSAVVVLYLLYLALSAALTALTVHLVRKYFGAEGRPAVPVRIKVERAKMDWRKWVPVGLMVLVAVFWSLYLVAGDAILPADFYLIQDDIYGLFLLGCALVCVLLFNWKGHRGMLVPSLGLVASCWALTGLLDWDSWAVYSVEWDRVLFSTSDLYHRFGQPSVWLYIALLVFTLIYVLCCHIRLTRSNITSL